MTHPRTTIVLPRALGRGQTREIIMDLYNGWCPGPDCQGIFPSSDGQIKYNNSTGRFPYENGPFSPVFSKLPNLTKSDEISSKALYPSTTRVLLDLFERSEILANFASSIPVLITKPTVFSTPHEGVPAAFQHVRGGV